jgi:hypothetical protein
VDWKIEDRYYLRIEEPKLNAWVVYNQWSRWSAAIFDRAAQVTVLELEEEELASAKRLVESYILQSYGQDVADRWMEDLTPRGGLEARGDVALIGRQDNATISKTRVG